jgi:HEAT repeat protein
MLGAVTGPAASALVAATRDPSDLVRVCAAEALGGATRDTPGARDALVRLLDDDNSLVRLYAVEALGYLGDTGVIPLLYEKMPGDWPEVRVWYRFALAQLGEPFDFGDVQDILRRGGYTARIQAATVLRLSATGDETEARAVAALQRALRRERHPAAREHMERLLHDLGATAPGEELAASER